MTRYVLSIICALLIFASLYGLRHPHSELAMFLNVSSKWAYARIGCAIATLSYVLINPLRQYAIRCLFALLGAAAIIYGLLSLTTYYVLILDSFALVGGGIYTLLASLELTTNYPVSWPLHLPQLPRFDFTMLRIQTSLYLHRKSTA